MAVCGRRFGKTVLGIDVAVTKALEGKFVGYYEPNFSWLDEVWNELKRVCADITVKKSEQTHRLFLRGGGYIDMWSLENPDSSRGYKYDLVIVDEAAFCPHLKKAWEGAIRPTLTDTKGDAYFLSTPNGKNYLYNLFLRSEVVPNWKSWRLPSYTNPFLSPIEIDAARDDMSEQMFLQEYMAEFLEDAGSVFHHVTEAVDAGRAENEKPNHKLFNYAMGWDLARYNDYSVITIFDHDGKQVYFERLNHVSWNTQIARVVEIIKEFRPYVCVDSTGVGDAVVEQLRNQCYEHILNSKTYFVDGVVFTTSSKGELMENLSIDIERHKLNLMDIPIQTNELLSYCYERTPTGYLRMSASGNGNDDCVASLALANRARGHIYPPPRIKEVLPKDSAAYIIKELEMMAAYDI